MHDVLDVFDGVMMTMMCMMHDIFFNMMMFAILSMLHDDECHVA